MRGTTEGGPVRRLFSPGLGVRMRHPECGGSGRIVRPELDRTFKRSRTVVRTRICKASAGRDSPRVRNGLIDHLWTDGASAGERVGPRGKEMGRPPDRPFEPSVRPTTALDHPSENSRVRVPSPHPTRWAGIHTMPIGPYVLGWHDTRRRCRRTIGRSIPGLESPGLLA
jgi:hypothetical protein